MYHMQENYIQIWEWRSESVNPKHVFVELTPEPLSDPWERLTAL